MVVDVIGDLDKVLVKKVFVVVGLCIVEVGVFFIVVLC